MTASWPPELPAGLAYLHLDVFTRRPLAGNGVIVFPDATGLDARQMLLLTQEMRQFESVVLTPSDESGHVTARIFTAEEELNFAGHPILGAAAVLHHFGAGPALATSFDLHGRTVNVSTVRGGGYFTATMNQGRPRVHDPIGRDQVAAVLRSINLDHGDLAPDLPVQVVSTGLPYLIVPIRRSIERIAITRPSFGNLLASMGAKFCYPLDVDAFEGRSFDNSGLTEDIATGSAAGPAAAYLVLHGRAAPGSDITIHQGRFLNRPSQMSVHVTADVSGATGVSITGDVVIVASGRLGSPA